MSAYPPYSSPPAPPGSPAPWESPPPPPASPTPWDSPPAPPGQPPPSYSPPAPPGAPPWTSGAPSSEKSSKTNIGAIIGAVVGGIVVIGIIIGLVVFFMNRRRRRGNNASDSNPKYDPALVSIGASDPNTKFDQSLGPTGASDPNTKFNPALGSMDSTPMPGGGARQYSLPEMDAATYNYKMVIGKGGFGLVYYGRLADGKEVAVKELDAASKQGFNEFFNELDILSRVHHRHLVSLYGYCRAGGKQMLVFEYIHKGALRDHLDGDTSKVGSVVLDWKTRLKIGLQATLGLEYLHTYCIPSLIHRDVKSTNILITSNNEAKVADFGLSRLVGEDDTSQVMTVVKGTPGYLDPEYFRTNQLSTYSDVYSFGVVLLELITGRMPIFTSTAPNQVNTTTVLTDWVRSSLMSGNDNIDAILDPKLRASRPNQDALWKVAEIALRSVEPMSMHRPTMNDVVQELQAAAALEKETPVTSSNSVHPPRAPPPRFH